MAPPTKHIAAVVVEGGGSVELKEIDVLKPGPNEVLVKVVAVALNPADWKTTRTADKAGIVAGYDLAGIVEELGPGADAVRKVGERIATFVARVKGPTNGAFAQYVVAKADFCIAVPDGWSFEDAAQLPVASYTASQTLYQSLDLPIPELQERSTSATEPATILIYGASSSVGSFAVQLAKAGGLTVHATCSPRNFDLVRGFGADVVYDYNDPEAAKKIKTATGGKLTLAVDTVTEHGKFISTALADAGGKVACIVPYKGAPRENVEPIFSVAPDLLIDRPGAVSRIADGVKYAKVLSELLAQGKLKPAPLLILPNGLASVNDGLKYMIDGKVSGQKLIFRIADTPGVH